MKNLVDKARDQQEVAKFAFYTQDNSEGANLLIKETAKRGKYRSRFLNQDALAIRNSIFKR